MTELNFSPLRPICERLTAIGEVHIVSSIGDTFLRTIVIYVLVVVVEYLFDV